MRAPCLFALLSLLAVAVPGCRPQPALSPAGLAEPSWTEQLEAVRNGTSQEITIPQADLTGEQWRAIGTLGERLLRLSVDRGTLSPQILADLSARLPRLQQLKLGVPIGNEHLAAITQFRSLKVLNLTDGDFNDAGLETLKSLPELELLRFHSPNVSNAGLKTIAALPALRFLHLIDVPITDAGLVHIAGMTELESFYLDGGGCTEEGLSELLKQRRNLHFHWNDLHLPDDPKR